jgi:predicted RecB family nuclease
MHFHAGTLLLAPTDVSNHLACRHLTQLDLARTEGRLDFAPRPDPRLDALRHRGAAHEKRFVDSLAADGLTILDLRDRHDPAATLAAMTDGTGAIVQAPLAHDGLSGRADVLLRSPAPSGLGGWSYEPADTKLARDTRAGTILQLSAYAVLLQAMQGVLPERMHVVTPLAAEAYRTAHFDAYFRFVRRRLEADLVADPPPATYPEPVAHCDVCGWWLHCDRRRRDDDHLSLVAGIRTLHARELERQAIRTVAALGATDGALPEPPRRGARETYEKLGHQARLQMAARTLPLPPFEPLPVEPGRGLARLPAPSPGDVFLDFEGDPFFGDGGLEYLTGWAYRDADGAWTYERRWALACPDERVACEAFLDFVASRLDAHPELHVYHFGAYEPSALKRLVSRHATRAELLDGLLRGGSLVDLHAAVREGFRIGVERYGLKELEPLAGFRREHDLRDAGLARVAVELALELGDTAAVDDALRNRVAAYNREDCLSAAALRDWLEARRAESREPVPRPEARGSEPKDHVRDRDQRIQDAAIALLSDVPDDPAARDDAQQARWRLAQMLGYFRREEKCAWWEHFRLRGLAPEELLEEREAVAGLEFAEELPKRPRQQVPVHRYRFPPQETALDRRDKLRATGGDDVKLGTVDAIDLAAGTIDIRKTKLTAGVHPFAVFRDQVVPAKELETSLLALAEHVRTSGLDGAGAWSAALDLLCRRPPRRRSGVGDPLRRSGEDVVDATVRLCRELDGGVLPIQGPPGSGKTYVGARAIVALVRDGKRVGVTAVSHKVIDNLLTEVLRAAAEKGVHVRVAHKADDDGIADGIDALASNDEAAAAVHAGAVVGGTAWLWADDRLGESVDYLVVDEAGQMALACVLAASRAARNVVLLGDPQQLEQPRRGAHPDGTDTAALVHVLGPERPTIGDADGLFLDRTWRLHPALCAFTSEVYYEGRLFPRDGLERQAVRGATLFAGSGLFLVEVEHEGNQASAPEEVDVVERVVRSLLGAEWIPRDGVPRALAGDGVLVLAPYNAQVAALRRRLRELGVLRVGTVDKFQGQEAAVVVYSCTSSSPEDAPRGMEFLYDPHRFNVATSRARGAVIVVASPRLFTAECRTLRQMRMVNGLCRYRELARVVEVIGPAAQPGC